MIKDLIDKLESEAQAEADSKSFCDENIKDAVEDRDKENLNMEEAKSTVAKEKAKVVQLTADIQVLSREISELSHALNEALELRTEEKAANEKTITDAEAGKAAVEKALDVLETFYKSAGGSLIQDDPAVDRSGKSINDLAPKTSFSGDYEGKKDSSTGVIGLLEVIKEDFARTIEDVGQAETDAEKKFDDFKSETNKAIKAKEKTRGEKEGNIKTAKSEITKAKDDFDDAEKLHASALKTLEKLKTMCVEGEFSWQERKAKREQEIKALREALTILEEWKD